jgi:DNA-binding response OmpR family regulator
MQELASGGFPGLRRARASRPCTPVRLRACELCETSSQAPPRRASELTIPGVLKAGPIAVDLIGGVALVGDDVVELQPLQLRILGLLVARAGHVVTHEELRASVFRAHQLAESTSIARQICVLRTRLGNLRRHIVTERDGYSLRSELRAGAVRGDDGSARESMSKW